MFLPAADKRAIEALWHSRLNDAKLRLDFAHNYLKEVQRDFEAGELSRADGDFAFEKALRAENLALAEYNRVLRIFTSLMADGKMPDEV